MFQTKVDWKNRTDATAKNNIFLPPPTAPYFAYNLRMVRTIRHFSFARRLTVSQFVINLCNPFHGKRLIDHCKLTWLRHRTELNQHGFPTATGMESIKQIKSSPLWTLNGEVVNIEASVPLLTRTGNLRVCARFGIVENLAVDELLEISSINRGICGIFSTELK